MRCPIFSEGAVYRFNSSRRSVCLRNDSAEKLEQGEMLTSLFTNEYHSQQVQEPR